MKNITHVCNRIGMPEIVLCVLLFANISRNTFLYTTIDNISTFDIRQLLELLTMVVGVVALLTNRKKLSLVSYIVVLITALILLVSSTRTGDDTLILNMSFFAIVYGFRINSKSACYSYFIAVALAVIVSVVFSLLGIIFNKDAIPNDRLVFSYGFVHPNTMGAYLFSASCAITFALRNTKRWFFPVCFSLLVAFFSKAFLSANAAFYLNILVASLNVAGRFAATKGRSHMPRKLYKISVATTPLILEVAILAIISNYNPENRFIAVLNEILHARLAYSHAYFLHIGGFTVLGQPLSELSVAGHYHNGLPFFSVDSMYSYFGLVYGLLTFLVMYIVYMRGVLRLMDTSSAFVAWCMIMLCALYLLFEGYGFYFWSSFPVVLLASALSAEKQSSIDVDSVTCRAKRLGDI